MTKIKFSRLLTILFWLIFIGTLALRLYLVGDRNIAFTSDQARDMIEIRQIAVAHIPKLLGPITDILGLYLGPFWFYFNLPPFILTHGDPLALVYWQIIWFHLSILFFYWLTKKKKFIFAWTSSFLLLTMPLGFLINRYSFNANAVVIFSIIYLTLLINPNRRWRFIEGLLVGLILQLEAPLGIIFLILSVINNFSASLLFGFGLTLVPQLIYEFRSHFLMSKALFKQFAGNSDYLGRNLGFGELLTDRFNYLKYIISQIFVIPGSQIFVSFFGLGYLLINFVKRRSVGFKPIFMLFVITSGFFLIVYRHSLKSWYLLGLAPLIGLTFTYLLESLSGKVKYIFTLIFCTLLFINLRQGIAGLNLVGKHSTDPSALTNLENTIAWVYRDAQDQGFKVYSYLPSVYDYPQQYLYWWLGINRYAYQPADVAYLPDQPEYVRFTKLLWQKRKPASGLVYLVVQQDVDHPDRENNWFGNFANICPELVKQFDYHVNIYRSTGNCSE